MPLMVGPLSFSGQVQTIRLLFPREITGEERPHTGSHPSKGTVGKQLLVVEKFRQKVVEFVKQRESVDMLVGHGAEKDTPYPTFNF